MKIVKNGGHRLFEQDPETARIVSEMLSDLEKHGMDAVHRYSQKFDDWAPARFELSAAQIDEAVAQLPKRVIKDTDYCMTNVRKFAQAQLKMFKPLEKAIRPGMTLGHKHIPVNTVGSYIPGGRYPMFGSGHWGHVFTFHN